MVLAEYFTPFRARESLKPRIAFDVAVNLGEFEPADERPAEGKDFRAADHEEARAAGACACRVD
jgi:hypothetical protein